MKKSLLAVALTAALPVLAQAQTNVVLFGRVDQAIESIKGGSGVSSLRLSDGVNSPSRFGVRGTEDLGGGLKGIFWLEQGFNGDTGTIGTAPLGSSGSSTAVVGNMWTRRSYLGLQGGFGSVLLGREYTPEFWTILKADVMGLGHYGQLGPITFGAGSGVRFSDGLFYNSPSFGGVEVKLAYTFGAENVASATRSAGRGYGANLEWAGGPVWLGVGLQNTKNALNTGSDKSWSAGGKFTIGGMWNIGAYYGRRDPFGNDNTQTTWAVNFGGDIGPHTFGLQYAQTKIAAVGTDPTGKSIGLRYGYNLSKRTQVYTTYGRMTNNSTGTFTIAGSNSPAVPLAGAGSDPSALAVGVAHNF
jgi:predicted porin